MIYLDNSATTHIDPEVLEAMLPYLQEEYGNPSSKYYTLAENAHKAVEQARQQVACLLNANPSEIIFTSGATESNNFILKGVADFYTDKGKHLITSPVEHKSILDTCKYLSSKGYDVTYLPVNSYGQVDIDTISSLVRPDTILVSTLWGNNEIASLNDVHSISSYAMQKVYTSILMQPKFLGRSRLTSKRLRLTFYPAQPINYMGLKELVPALYEKQSFA